MPEESGVEISVLCSGAAKAALLDIKPAFERATGHALKLSFNTTGVVFDRIASGEAIDLVITASGSLDDLMRQGHVTAGSKVEVARSGIGAVVRAGQPKPDISTPQAFKAALLAARTVAYTEPKSGGASGVHFARILTQLGIADEVNAKARYGDGGPIALIVARGEAEIGMHQIPELLGHAGIDYLGPLPAELQSHTLAAAAIPTRARARDGAQLLIRFLTSPESQAIMRAKGMD
ncbi:MAG: substrate-binding domain-containing protein [Alphaproteobacteria bacterium]|nr:substrate-binding domain-containing protein [Alphaproteobacteria bacterium]